MQEYALTIYHNGAELARYHAHTDDGGTGPIFDRGIATLHDLEPDTAGEGWAVVRQDQLFTAYGHTTGGGAAVDDLYTLTLTPWEG